MYCVAMTDPELAWESRYRESMRVIREQLGVTQTDLAATIRKEFDLPFHQQTVQRIEKGERPIRLNEAYAISATLGWTVGAMIEGRAPAAMVARLHGEADELIQDARLALVSLATAMARAQSLLRREPSALEGFSEHARPRDPEHYLAWMAERLRSHKWNLQAVAEIDEDAALLERIAVAVAVSIARVDPAHLAKFGDGNGE